MTDVHTELRNLHEKVDSLRLSNTELLTKLNEVINHVSTLGNITGTKRAQAKAPATKQAKEAPATPAAPAVQVVAEPAPEPAPAPAPAKVVKPTVKKTVTAKPAPVEHPTDKVLATAAALAPTPAKPTKKTTKATVVVTPSDNIGTNALSYFKNEYSSNPADVVDRFSLDTIKSGKVTIIVECKNDEKWMADESTDQNRKNNAALIWGKLMAFPNVRQSVKTEFEARRVQVQKKEEEAAELEREADSDNELAIVDDQGDQDDQDNNNDPDSHDNDEVIEVEEVVEVVEDVEEAEETVEVKPTPVAKKATKTATTQAPAPASPAPTPVPKVTVVKAPKQPVAKPAVVPPKTTTVRTKKADV